MGKLSVRATFQTALALVVLTSALTPAARAQQTLWEELEMKAMACRSARNTECFRACLIPSRKLRGGASAPDSEVEACRAAYAKFEPTKPAPTPAWAPEYAPLPDIVGIFRGAGVVDAKGRDDWKRHCRSSAQLDENDTAVKRDIPKGATVKLSGVRYVTNPIRSFDRSKSVCRADRMEVISAP